VQNLLSGLRIVEGSAFVAAPSGGMTLAQLGADVIRFDQIGGGIDYRRWPVTEAGDSLYWHSLNKGKRSIAVDFRKPEGRELLTALICAQGSDAGLFLSNFPARGWLGYEALQASREDLIYLNLTGDRHEGSALGLHRERARGRAVPQWRRRHASQQCAAGLGHHCRAADRPGAASR
jgi:2-methylfumaryl-CoA isomerase